MSKGLTRHKVPALKMDYFPKTYFSEPANSEEFLKTGSIAGFEIFHIADEVACKKAALPHRLKFYMISLSRAGEGIYHFGDDEYYVKENTLCFVSPYVLTSWHSQTPGQQGYCCTFSEAFFNEGLENKQLLQQLSFFEPNGHLVIRLATEETAYYAALMEDMRREAIGDSPQTADIIRTLLQLFLRKAQAAFHRTENRFPAAEPSALRLTKMFLDLCRGDLALIKEGKLSQVDTLTGYAARLHVTQNHMNDTVKEITGQSAGQHIQQLLATEATALLKQSTLSISEIAFMLGFNDPAYFSRFYKKQKGVSPSSLR